MNRCECCMGIGLVKKDVNDLRIKICDCNANGTCYLCENTGRLGTYKECEICYGRGELPVSTIKETHNKIPIVNKNE